VHVGTLVSVGVVLASPAAKADAARRFQALACDMESAAVAQVAAAASVPFLAIRVIADGPEDVLPAHVDRWVDDAGDSRIAPVLGALLRPQQWPPLFTLIRSYRAARATLEFVAAQLAPALYCCPGSR
jgi:nucleoside phosphorylase